MRHPIQCIIPPHIFKHIRENGSPLQKKWVSDKIKRSVNYRWERELAILAESAVSKKVSVKKQRIVYDALNGAELPGKMARNEDDGPTGDLSVDEAFDGSGAVYDLFHSIYDRNSIDNKGMVIKSTVHYQRGYDNAFWNGKQMVYGDGDMDLPAHERLFNRFTVAVDIIGHELAHGVTGYESQLVYEGQSGALNESFSDVFGALVKQWKLKQTAAKADWIIGAGLFTSNVNGKGIRSLKEPGKAYDDKVIGKDPQPAHMDDYQEVEYDNGGVHINSGIPNHAFYLTAIEIGGYAWEKAGHIWYRTLCDKLKARSKFQDAAEHSFMVAGELYGRGSLEQKAVRKGWKGVGVN